MILVIDCGTELQAKVQHTVAVNDIVRILQKLNAEFEIVPLNKLPKVEIEFYEKVIISGSKLFLTEMGTVEFLESFTWIKKFRGSIFGICFGHQVLGMVHGARISRFDKKIEGKSGVAFLRPNDPLFHDLGRWGKFDKNHEEYINLPKGFIQLAASQQCPMEAMRHREKPFYGVQFHPERSGPQGEKLIENFLKI